jgi:hypothetical protein
MIKRSNIGIPTVLPLIICVGIALSSVSADASTIGLSDVSKLEVYISRPDTVPPVNPPIDTPAFYNGLLNVPTTMPEKIPSHTLPGSGFGQTAVPIPAPVWLFGSGLLGLVGIARRKKAA